jgi:hypothetical protein
MHELLHTSPEEKPVDHDFAGFAAEVRRYGAWQDNLKLCKEAWSQPPLFVVERVDPKSGELTPG